MSKEDDKSSKASIYGLNAEKLKISETEMRRRVELSRKVGGIFYIVAGIGLALFFVFLIIFTRSNLSSKDMFLVGLLGLFLSTIFILLGFFTLKSNKLFSYFSILTSAIIFTLGSLAKWGDGAVFKYFTLAGVALLCYQTFILIKEARRRKS